MEIALILDKIEDSLEGEAHLDELANKKQDPFKILISTILSARTRDTNTKEATETLFSRYHTPQEIANADIDELERLIYKSGFYRVKAVRIKEVSKLLLERFNSKVPHKLDDLLSLPGVGAKTANCVLVYAFKIPAIPVDTHVHRVSNRLRWVNTKNTMDTEKELKILIPKSEWIRVNRLLVRFGQELCLPNNPKCNECPLNESCPKDFSMELFKKKKNTKRK